MTIELHDHLLLPTFHQQLTPFKDSLPVFSEHLLLVHFPCHGVLEATLNLEEKRDRFLHHIKEFLLLVALAEVFKDKTACSLLLQFDYVALRVANHLDGLPDVLEADHVDDDVTSSLLKPFLYNSAVAFIISVGAGFPFELRHLNVKGSCLER